MLLRSVSALAIVVACLGVAPGPAAAQNAAQGDLLARAITQATVGNWPQAHQLARLTGNPIADDIVEWTRLRDGAGDWQEYGDFLSRNPDWPSQPAMRRAAERVMPSGQPPEAILAFFTDPPETGTGSLRLAEALSLAGREAEAEAEIVRAWTTFSMTAGERKSMYGRWRDELAPHHQARLDMLLWRGLTGEAQGMLSLVGDDWRKLAEARIATRRDAAGMQYLINQVPPRLRDDPGLAYERYLYRVEKRRWQEAEAFLLERSTSAAALGRPEMWMERRANLARQALEDGDVKGAYRIAAQSFGSEGADYADAEWVAGFIALTRLDDPAAAIGHFERFRAVVVTPISLGRAGDRLGAAYEQAGEAEKARLAFARGALHQTSFYGQLAAEKLGASPDPQLAGAPAPVDWRDAPVMRRSVVQAAYFLHVAGDDVRTSQFFRAAAEGQSAEDRAALAQMAIDLGRPHVGVRIAKDAAADGIILSEQYYPLHEIAGKSWPVPTEFAMAIARQESEFNAAAASGVGASGLMQLMPATARDMADAARLPFEPVMLTADPIYNARLGTEYLRRMLAYFDGSYLLATAAYNAGPGRVDEWLRTNGDPRNGKVDPVVWIESIPFTETRNYVMRVLEALHVYRARLQGRAEPLQLVADIASGGEVVVSSRNLAGAVAAVGHAPDLRLPPARPVRPAAPEDPPQTGPCPC